MPKVATSAKAKFTFKERGGKVQLAFRDALGLCEREDLQFQKIKHDIRGLAIKYFVIGLKPREQAKHRKEKFLKDVYGTYPVFRRSNDANAHLLKYVDQFLQSKAARGSPYHKKVHPDIADEDDVEDDDKSDDENELESTFNLVHGSPGQYHDEETVTANPESQETTNDEPEPFDSHPYVDYRRGAIRVSAGVRPSNGSYCNMGNSKSSFEDLPDPSTSTNQTRVNSPSPDPPISAAIPQAKKLTTLSILGHSHNLNTSQTSPNNSVNVPSVKAFLRHAQLSHLYGELMALGIKNQSRLRLIAEWQECDVNELLRGSRMDRFEVMQLTVAFRSLRHSLVSFDADGARDVN